MLAGVKGLFQLSEEPSVAHRGRVCTCVQEHVQVCVSACFLSAAGAGALEPQSTCGSSSSCTGCCGVDLPPTAGHCPG